MDSYTMVQLGRLIFSVLFVIFFLGYRVKSTYISHLSCNQTVLVNNTAVCLCIATDKPTTADITWLRDGSILNRTHTNITNNDGGNNCDDDDPNNKCVSWSLLELFHTQPADSGTYVCIAINYYSRVTVTKSVNITVEVIPVIINPPLNNIGKVLRNITSRCAAIANPRAVIQWKKNGKLLSNKTLNNKPKILITNSTDGNCTITDPPSHCRTFSTLKIFSTQYDDNGEYICSASNKAGSTSQSANFTVIVAPVITMQTVNKFVEALKNVSFYCTAVAKPQASIEWIKNGNTLTNMSDDYNITKFLVTRSTKGNCWITDPISECERSSILSIFNTKPDDSGNYVCTANNEAGYVEESAHLSVDGFPIIVASPTNKEFVEYSNVSFSCISIGYPRPDVKWLKDGIVLRNSTSHIAIYDCERGNCESINCVVYSYLWILNATINDVGNYTCNATNFAGFNATTAQLTLVHSDNDHDALSLILGSIAGGLIGFVALVLILVLIHRRKSLQDQCKQRQDDGGNDDDECDVLLRSGHQKKSCSIQ